MMQKSIILILTVSILLIPIWGLTFLDSETSSSIATFLGLSFTLYLYDLTRNYVSVRSPRYLNLLFLIGPSFYLGTQIFTEYSDNGFSLLEFVFSPILWALVVLIAFMLTPRVYLKNTVIIFLFSSYLYAFHLYPIYKRLFNGTNMEGTIEVNENRSATTDILSYDFLAAGNKIKRFPVNGRPVLIETWNEKCKPCLNSISRLESFIDDSLNVNHVLLYENFGNNNLSPDQVFSFDKIEDKTKILVDLNGAFYKDAGMESLPYFLLYDEKGDLVDYFSGFNESTEDETKARLKKILSEI